MIAGPRKLNIFLGFVKKNKNTIDWNVGGKF